MPKYCQVCGTRNRNDAIYCTQCGKIINGDSGRIKCGFCDGTGKHKDIYGFIVPCPNCGGKGSLPGWIKEEENRPMSLTGMPLTARNLLPL